MEPPRGQNPPPPPSPFTTPTPFEPAPIRPRGGCGKPALIGCGVLLLLFGIGMILLVAKMPALLSYFFERMEQQVVAQAAPDVTAEDKRRLHEAFAAAREAMVRGKADTTRSQELNGKLMEISRRSPIPREAILELTEVLEAVAGRKPPA